jgi:hypothetical protein
MEIEIGLKPINKGTEYAIVEIGDLRPEKMPKVPVKAEEKLKVELVNMVTLTHPPHCYAKKGDRLGGELVLPATFNGKPITRIDNETAKGVWGAVDKGYYEKVGKFGLTKITLPEGITVIGDSAFENFMDIEFFSIPGSVKTIGKCAFGEQSNCKSIVIANGVETIGMYAFSNNGLTEIIIPESVTFIDESAFQYCESLKEIVIPESVTSIGKNAFEGCDNLEKVTLPLNAKLGKNIFKDCDNENLTITTGGKTEKINAWKKRIKEDEKKAKEAALGQNTQNVFSGKIVVFTGTLELCTRDAAKKMVESLGGQTANDITSKVNLLVIGKNAGSKTEKAKKQGIEIMTEAEFAKIAGNAPVPTIIKFKKEDDQFTATIDWCNSKTEISYEDEEDKELNQTAKDFAQKIFEEQADWDKNAKEILAEFYDDEYDQWRKIDKVQVSKTEFLEQMPLNLITVTSDGIVEFWFSNNKLIGGHSLILEGTIEDGFEGTCQMMG